MLCSIQLFQKTGTHSNEVDSLTLLRIYCSFIRFRCNNGITNYSTANKTDLNTLKLFYYRTLRLASGTFLIIICINLYLLCNENPLNLRRQLLFLSHIEVPMHAIFAGEHISSQNLLCKMILFQISNNSKITCILNINNDLPSCNLHNRHSHQKRMAPQVAILQLLRQIRSVFETPSTTPALIGTRRYIVIDHSLVTPILLVNSFLPDQLICQYPLTVYHLLLQFSTLSSLCTHLPAKLTLKTSLIS